MEAVAKDLRGICCNSNHPEECQERHHHVTSYKCNSRIARYKHIRPQDLFTCCCCDLTYDTRVARNHHELTHNKTYKCKLCSCCYNAKGSLIRHTTDFHITHSYDKTHINGKPRFVCVVCKEIFRYQRNLFRHMDIVHIIKNRDISCIMTQGCREDAGISTI